MKKYFALALIAFSVALTSQASSVVDTDNNVEYVIGYDSPDFVAIEVVSIGSSFVNVTVVPTVFVASVEGVVDIVSIDIDNDTLIENLTNYLNKTIPIDKELLVTNTINYIVLLEPTTTTSVNLKTNDIKVKSQSPDANKRIATNIGKLTNTFS